MTIVKRKLLTLGLTKQFLTLAFAGIAFVVGLSFNTPGSISSLMLWFIIGAFGLSTILGLAFLMRGVNLLSIQKSFDIYAPSLRFLAIFQILLVLTGVVLLIPILDRRPTNRGTPSANSMDIKVDPRQSLVYPIDPEKNVIIEIEGAKLKITATKK
jgi:hypothetical protein